jgi:putative hemolysin
MLQTQPNHESVVIRLAESPAEIEAAQRLRYRVFYEEYAAVPDAQAALDKIDRDDFDDVADHLIAIDRSIAGDEQVVGTYRLLRRENAERSGGFYSSGEYDLSPILNSGMSVLELGRSCVMPEYRSRPVLQLLWQGIANYIARHNIDLMFGCASLPSTDVASIAAPLSYLYHFHMAPEALRPRAVKGRYINMNLVPKEDLNPRQAFASLPPLIKGYLRVGATIGDGAVIDTQFNTTDVCIIVQTHTLPDRYRQHHERERKNQRSAALNGNGDSEIAD